MSDHQPGYAGMLLKAFRYPFTGDGLYLIGGGAVFFTVADFVSAHASFVGIFIQLIIAGYLAAYAKDVVRTSAMGEDEPPKWLDFSDWMADLVTPALEFLFVLGLSFGALIALQFKSPFHGQAHLAATLLAGAWGCLAFPILFLAVAMMDSVAAVLNPLPLLRAVGVTWRTYLLTCLFCILVVGLDWGVGAMQTAAAKVPVIPQLIGWLVMLYLFTTLMRGVGLFYRVNHERLGWY